MLGNISKLSKWWKKQLEENLLIVVWKLQNENSGKVKKGGGLSAGPPCIQGIAGRHFQTQG